MVMKHIQLNRNGQFLKKLTFESYKLYNFQEGEKKDKKLSYWHDIFTTNTTDLFSGVSKYKTKKCIYDFKKLTLTTDKITCLNSYSLYLSVLKNTLKNTMFH